MSRNWKGNGRIKRHLMRKHMNTCVYCKCKVTEETATIDHVMPLSKGGTHTLDNLWILEAKINSAKGTMSVAEFIAMCRDVTRYQDGLKYKTA